MFTFPQPVFQPSQFLFCHRLQFCVGLLAHHRFRFGNAALEVFVLAEFGNKLTEVGMSLCCLLISLAVGHDFGIRELLRQFVVTRLNGAKFINEQVGGRTHNRHTVKASSRARIAIST